MTMQKAVIGVAGAGVMGGGIAQMFAEHGFHTLVWDATEECAARGVANIARRLDKSVEKGSATADGAKAVKGRIRTVGDLSGLASAELVVEAVIEDHEIKCAIFRELEKILPPQAIIGTNSSSLSVTELARSLARPERFLGTHFFNPPTKLELVELVTHPGTDQGFTDRVKSILAACGKIPVTAADSPGFIVNRLLLPFINEAAALVDAGVATAEDIDKAMCLGALHPAGPLQVADLIGLDICRDILESLSRSMNEPRFKPAKGIVARVEAGHLGRKTGRGFYQY